MKTVTADFSPELLAAELKDRDWMKRLRAVESVAKRPTVQHITAFRSALSDENNAVAKTAARALGKLGPRAASTFDDLIAAATAPWEYGCPQLFCDAIEALEKNSPNDPRLVEVIQGVLKCSNYGIQKAAIISLEKIGSDKAIETILNLDKYWTTSPVMPPFQKLLVKILDDLEERSSDGLAPHRVAARERLIDWLGKKLHAQERKRKGVRESARISEATTEGLL